MPERTAADAMIGAGGVTAPAWLQYFHGVSQEVVVIGGAILIVIRVWLAVRDLMAGRRPKVD